MVTVQPVTTNQLVVTVPNMGGTAGTYFPILGLPNPPYSGSNYEPALPYVQPADEFSYS